MGIQSVKRCGRSQQISCQSAATSCTTSPQQLHKLDCKSS